MPESRLNVSPVGVLGVLPGIVGAIQANETIKLLLGRGEPLVGRLLLFDAWTMRFRELALRRDPACPLCGPRRTVTELVDYEQFCGVGPADAPAGGEGLEEITAVELKRRIDDGVDVQIVDVREPHEWAIARLPGAVLIPLGDVVRRAGEIDAARVTIVHCKGGTRSAKAIAALRDNGFAGRLVNLQGGILAWARDVDPGVPTY